MKTYNLLNPISLFRMFLCILLIIAVFPIPSVSAFEWFTANQTTIVWDAVTLNSDGQPLDASDTVEYSVYLSDSTLPLKDSSVVIWRGPETQTTLTLSEGTFYVGVRTHRIRDGTEVNQSTVSWSDDPAVTNDNTWGLSYWLPPSVVNGLRPVVSLIN